MFLWKKVMIAPICAVMLASLFCAVMLASLSGCAENGNSSNDSGAANTSNSSEAEEKPKTIAEVLGDFSGVKNYDYSLEFTATGVVASAVPLDNDSAGGLVETQKDTQTVSVSLNGSANEKGEMSFMDIGVTADLFGDGVKPMKLSDIVVTENTAYINLKPIVALVKEQAGEYIELPEAFGEIEYVSITEEDIKKLADMLGENATVDGTDFASIDKEQAAEGIASLYDKSVAFMKAFYGKNEFITQDENTYTFKVDKSNYKTFVDATVAVIDDGSMKTYLLGVEESLAFFNTEDNAAVDIGDIDETLAQMKEELTAITDEDIGDMTMTATLVAPFKDDKSYRLNISGSVTDEDGYKSEVGFKFEVTPKDSVEITAPSNVTALDELISVIQEAINGEPVDNPPIYTGEVDYSDISGVDNAAA